MPSIPTYFISGNSCCKLFANIVRQSGTIHSLHHDFAICTHKIFTSNRECKSATVRPCVAANVCRSRDDFTAQLHAGKNKMNHVAQELVVLLVVLRT